MTWCLSDNIAQMPEVNHLLELSGFHFDLICQIKCNNAVQVGCKATRQALNLMFLTNDQTHNRSRLQRVTWLNRIDVQTRTRRQEEEANWLYTTLSVSRDMSVSHQLQNTDLFLLVPNSLNSWTRVWVWLTRVTSVAGAGSWWGSDDETGWREHIVTCHTPACQHCSDESRWGGALHPTKQRGWGYSYQAQ